jgi:predicted GIY-YIG superfamily endonuclease
VSFYILRCADGSYYVGHTDNLEMRIASHDSGEFSGYTRYRRPVRLVFTESFASRDEAFRCERQIKGWSRRKKEALIRGDWDALSRLSRARDSIDSGSPRPTSTSAHPSTSSG